MYLPKETLTKLQPWLVLKEHQPFVYMIIDETVPLWGFHLKDRDFTHFCNPSGYELWTHLFKEKLTHSQPWLAP